MARAASDYGTVGKTLEVLDLVAAHGRPMRFSEIQAELSFPKATLYRFVQTLTGLGMLTYDSDRQVYSLGLRLVRLAHSAWMQSSLAPVARDQLDALARDLGETVHLAQLDGAHVLYVDKRNSPDRIEMFSSAGKVGPAYCTGVGKAMLAFLPEDELADVLSQQSYHRFTEHTLTSATALKRDLDEIRSRGIAFDREEHEPGIVCIAAPILPSSGKAAGAISVTSTTARRSLKDLEALAPRVRAAADAIAADVQAWRFPDDITQTPRTRTG